MPEHLNNADGGGDVVHVDAYAGDDVPPVDVHADAHDYDDGVPPVEVHTDAHDYDDGVLPVDVHADAHVRDDVPHDDECIQLHFHFRLVSHQILLQKSHFSQLFPILVDILLVYSAFLIHFQEAACRPLNR